jgi:hypothetical protein
MTKKEMENKSRIPNQSYYKARPLMCVTSLSSTHTYLTFQLFALCKRAHYGIKIWLRKVLLSLVLSCSV